MKHYFKTVYIYLYASTQTQKIVTVLYNIIENMYSKTCSLSKIINFNYAKLP